jgi:PAS domain S-box-containing protein
MSESTDKESDHLRSADRLRADDVLQASEIRYRRLFEAAKDGILILDADTGKIVDVNPFLMELTGYSHEDFLGMFLWEIGPFKDVAASRISFAELQTKEYVRYEDLPLRTREGAKVEVEFISNLYSVENRNVIQCFIRDITERKRADEKILEHRDRLEAIVSELATAVGNLERSNKDLEQFAYVASHDLQEPLRMISSYTQLLAQKYEGLLDDKAKKYIAYAVDGAMRMQGLISDLLTYSRIGTQGKPFEPTDSHKVLCEVLRILQAAIEESGAVVTNDDLPTVRADTGQLVQVLQNLIANAVKFRGADSPHVHVSAQYHGHEWRFSVKDNGIGIDPQYADRLFVIFQRLHTRQEYPGTGIGLAVCKRVVERHGGRIWFESNLGRGSTFFFTIQE